MIFEGKGADCVDILSLNWNRFWYRIMDFKREAKPRQGTLDSGSIGVAVSSAGCVVPLKSFFIITKSESYDFVCSYNWAILGFIWLEFILWK